MFGNVPKIFGDIAPEMFSDMLYEITSGFSCFGKMPEWSEWFHFSLAEYTSRPESGNVHNRFGEMVSAFVALYPESSFVEPYIGFRRDAVNSLGRVLMSPDLWGDAVLTADQSFHRDEKIQFSKEFGGEYFSASLFFCLKYLPLDELFSWLNSVLNIPCVNWRKQLIVWLFGAHPLLTGKVKQVNQLSNSYPNVSWKNSFLLNGNYTGVFTQEALNSAGDFLPAENRERFLEFVRRRLRPEVFKAWNLEYDGGSYFEEEFAYAAERFEELYFRQLRLDSSIANN